jgi:hypothetical protein
MNKVCDGTPLADGNGLGGDGVIYPGDPAHCEQCEKIYQKAFHEGVESVLYLRCLYHQRVPQYNRQIQNQAECPACTIESPAPEKGE